MKEKEKEKSEIELFIYDMNKKLTGLERKAAREYVLNCTGSYLKRLDKENERKALVSMLNFYRKHKFTSCLTVTGKPINIGDIVLVDFGVQYMYECSFIHPAIVLQHVGGKALVVPLSSNPEEFSRAYHNLYNKEGHKTLYRIYKQSTLDKDSVARINDFKCINYARIVDVVGNLEQDSLDFMEVRLRVARCVFNGFQLEKRCD